MTSLNCNGCMAPSLLPHDQIIQHLLGLSVVISQWASVSVVMCSPEHILGPNGDSRKHPIHVLFDLNQGSTLVRPFQWCFHFLALPQEQELNMADIIVHENEVFINGTSEQTHVRKDHLLIIIIYDNRHLHQIFGTHSAHLP